MLLVVVLRIVNRNPEIEGRPPACGKGASIIWCGEFVRADTFADVEVGNAGEEEGGCRENVKTKL